MWSYKVSMTVVAFFWEAAAAIFCQTPLSSIFATFPILYVWEAVAAFFYTFSSLCLLSSCCFFLPNLPSPLFCRWWNCLSPYIIWHMSWWSRTCEKLGIISSRPYITFSSLLCYDALMLQVHDQMMIDMFLRPLLLPLLIFLIYCYFIGLLWCIDLFYFLYLLAYLKHTFLHLLEQSAK